MQFDEFLSSGDFFLICTLFPKMPECLLSSTCQVKAGEQVIGLGFRVLPKP